MKSKVDLASIKHYSPRIVQALWQATITFVLTVGVVPYHWLMNSNPWPSATAFCLGGFVAIIVQWYFSWRSLKTQVASASPERLMVEVVVAAIGKAVLVVLLMLLVFKTAQDLNKIVVIIAFLTINLSGVIAAAFVFDTPPAK